MPTLFNLIIDCLTFDIIHDGKDSLCPKLSFELEKPYLQHADAFELLHSVLVVS